MPATVGEMEAGDQDVRPSWSYATKKTAGKGLLNASLLLTNAAQLKALFELHSGDRDGFWVALLVLISISIVLQLVVTVMLVVLGLRRPRTGAALSSTHKLNDATVVMAVIISLINTFIAAFGVELSSSSD